MKEKNFITIDDGYQSFYENAWPILKEFKNSFYFICKYKRGWKKRIYELGKYKEIEKYDFVEIGNHSHTHEYLIDFTDVK